MSRQGRLFPALLSVPLALLISLTGCAEEPTSLAGATSTGSGPPSGTGTPSTSGGGGADGEGGAAAGTGSPGSSGAGTATGQVAGSGASGAGGAGPQPATFELSIDESAPEMDLRASAALTLSIAANGYVGPVSLTALGAPEDVLVELDAASVDLDGVGSETVAVAITTASDTASGAFALTFVGTVPAGEKEAAAVVTVQPILTIIIPEGLNGLSSDPPNTTAFGDFPTRVRALEGMGVDNPVTILFFNADTVSHEIHADRPDQGFGHGNQPIPARSFDPVVREVNAPGTYDYYPHDIGQSILGRIVIE